MLCSTSKLGCKLEGIGNVTQSSDPCLSLLSIFVAYFFFFFCQTEVAAYRTHPVCDTDQGRLVRLLSSTMAIKSKDNSSSPEAAEDKSDKKKDSTDEETKQENISQVCSFPVKFECYNVLLLI